MLIEKETCVITVIRQCFKGIGFKIIAWLTIISVIGIGGVGVSQLQRARKGRYAGKDEEWVISVNDQKVGLREFSRVTELRSDLKEAYMRQFRAQFGPYAEMMLRAYGLDIDPKVMALKGLFAEELLNQVAQEMNLNLQPDYIAYRLADPITFQNVLAAMVPIRVFDMQGNVDQQAMNRYLHYVGIDAEEFDLMIKDALQRELLMQCANTTSYVPHAEISERYLQDYAKKRFSMLTIAAEPFFKKEADTPISDDELNTFFGRESKRYMVPEKRMVTVWTFEPSDYQFTISDKDIEEYYNQYRAAKFVEKPEQIQVRRILFKVSENDDAQAIVEKANVLRQELVQNPDLFAQKAKELSDDKESAVKEGLLPYFAKGTKDAHFEKAAFLLKEDNAIAEPIITADGVELIQRIARKPAEYKELSAVADTIRQDLTVHKFNELFMEDVHDIIDRQEISEEEFKAFVEKRKGAVNEAIVDENDQSRMARVAFSLDKQGMNCYIDNGKGIAVKLTDVNKRFLPPLEQLKENVMHDLHKDRAMRTFSRFMRDLACRSTIDPIEVVTKAADGNVMSIDWLDPKNTKQINELRKKNVPVSEIMRLEKVGNVYVQSDEHNGILVRLDEIESFNEQDFADKESELAKRLEDEEAHLFGQGFVASLYRNATIITNESIIDLGKELAI